MGVNGLKNSFDAPFSQIVPECNITCAAFDTEQERESTIRFNLYPNICSTAKN